MRDIKDKLLVMLFAALYTTLFFNWFIYLIQTNFEVILDMRSELLIKGLVIGFSAHFICAWLKLPYFVPYGWLGALAGFNVTNYLLVPLLTPYPSLLGLGLGDTMAMEFLLFKALVAGSILFVLGKFLGIILIGEGGEER